jgi:BirA family biotin operon repressor/biotin-[acetyl-CoA-carboxylase] ligase
MLSPSQRQQIDGYHFHHYQCVDSTNTTAFALLNDSAATPLVVSTQRQTAGKGQHNRQWCSSEGSLTFSIAMTMDRRSTAMPSLPVLSGLAVCRSINLTRQFKSCANAAPQEAQVKWPNDVLIDNKKVGGILVQTRPSVPRGNEFFECVIGIGININDADGLIRQTVATDQRDALFGAGDLQTGCQHPISKSKLLVDIVGQIDNAINLFNRCPPEILPGPFWQSGNPIRVSRPNGKIINGVHMGVASDGSLLLDHDGQIERIYSGSIVG